MDIRASAARAGTSGTAVGGALCCCGQPARSRLAYSERDAHGVARLTSLMRLPTPAPWPGHCETGAGFESGAAAAGPRRGVRRTKAERTTMTTRKLCRELCREGTILARHAAELRQAGMALLKRATELQRQSEKALRRSVRTKKRADQALTKPAQRAAGLTGRAPSGSAAGGFQSPA
jgi:hypothetical protein